MIGSAMARVDFYLLAESGDLSRQTFACRLAEKAYRLKNTVHIQAADRLHAQQLDGLLWTFRDGSFVPHELAGAQSGPSGPPASPITIGWTGEDLRPGNLLINLADELPETLQSFTRVAEIVTSDEDCRRRGRKRFAEYRSRGHDLQLHQL